MPQEENFDIDSIMEARRKALESSIKNITIEEVRALAATLFSEYEHPWKDAFNTFIEENRSGTFYLGTTHEGIQILYCREKEKGIWFKPGGGMGPLQSRGIAILKDIVAIR